MLFKDKTLLSQFSEIECLIEGSANYCSLVRLVVQGPKGGKEVHDGVYISQLPRALHRALISCVYAGSVVLISPTSWPLCLPLMASCLSPSA